MASTLGFGKARIDRLQERPLWAVLSSVFAHRSTPSVSALRFLEGNLSFTRKVRALLRRLQKRSCGNPACLCGPPFQDDVGLSSLLKTALRYNIMTAALAISDLEQAIDATIVRLKQPFECAACLEARRRSIRHRISAKPRRARCHTDSGS